MQWLCLQTRVNDVSERVTGRKKQEEEGKVKSEKEEEEK